MPPTGDATFLERLKSVFGPIAWLRDDQPGLADGIQYCHLRRIINGWSRHRTRALLLAVLLGVCMSLSLVQGNLMAAEMALAADDAHHGPSGCDGCGGSDHEGMDAGAW